MDRETVAETEPRAPASEPVLAPEPEPAPATVRAEVELLAVKGGAAIGQVIFWQRGDQVVIEGYFVDLPPGLRGIRVNERGDCGGKDAKRSGGHFNPTGARHGPPESPQRHAGDFGNIHVGADRRATFEMSTDSLTVVEGPDSVVGRALVITARRDNGKSEGSAGPAIACGVIELNPESSAAATSSR